MTEHPTKPAIDPRVAQRAPAITLQQEPDRRTRVDISTREAMHTLEEYLKEMAAGATSGAAAGAIGGAAAGGVGAVPGAGVGALGGALLGAGTMGVQDLWDAVQPDYNKASARAGTVQQRLDQIANLLGDNPLARTFQYLGAQYKDFIDGHVQQRADINLGQNVFQQEINRSRTPTAARGKFTRIAFLNGTSDVDIDPLTGRPRLPRAPGAYQATEGDAATGTPTESSGTYAPAGYTSSPAGYTAAPYGTSGHYSALNMEGSGAPNARNPFMEEMAPGMAANIAVQETAVRPLEDAAMNAVRQRYNIETPHAAPVNLWKNLGEEGLGALKNPEVWKDVWTGAKGFGAGLVADMATRYIWDMGKNAILGVKPQVDGAVNEIKGLITQINGYAQNDAATIEAGNQLWRALADLQSQMAQAATRPNAPEGSSQTPGTGAVTNAPIPSPESTVTSASGAKFMRLT